MIGNTNGFNALFLSMLLVGSVFVGLAGVPGTATANHGNTSVTFDNQTATTTVVVSNLTVQNDGYVTIHNESFTAEAPDGISDSIIGVSDHLSPGNHTNVTVTLYTDVPGMAYNQTELTENATLTAALYGETNTSSGNTTFNRVTHEGRYEETGVRDGPYRDDTEDARIIHDTAEVTVNTTANGTTDDDGTVGDDGASDDDDPSDSDDDGADDGGTGADATTTTTADGTNGTTTDAVGVTATEETETTTSTDGETTTDAETTASGGAETATGGPGFTAVLALVALVGAALVAARRA